MQAALYMLSFYDPYTVVNDITADPDDPNAKGADLTRALDAFGVYPGSCVYCKGQRYDNPRQYIQAILGQYHDTPNPVFQRTKLLNLVHHATVQADMLSPCNLKDFSEEELLALGVMDPEFIESRLSYGGGMTSFTHSVRLTDRLLDAASEGAAAQGVPDSWIANAPGLLVQPGEILSPFTHAIRAIGGPPTARGIEQCLEAVNGIVDWDRKRYYHFDRQWTETMVPYLEYIFPENPHTPPAWAIFLVYESGGQDKGERLAAQFRSLNMPAVKHLASVHLNESAERSIVARGPYGILLPAFSLYIHRNIGFSPMEKAPDIEEVVQRIPIPDHCELRRGEGSFQHGTVRVEYVCSKTTRSLTDPPSGMFKTLSVGDTHACALRADGTPVCWGNDAFGKSSPPAGEKFTAISAGGDQTCALRANGTPVCWGDDVFGRSSPPSEERFTHISVGFSYVGALREDGTPAYWGFTPERFLSSSFREIDAGEWRYLCGIRTDGNAQCTSIPEPIPHPEGVEFVSISAGRLGACALAGDGTPSCWGIRAFGENPPPEGKFTTVSVGADFACGLREDGTAECWGSGVGDVGISLPAGEKFKDISLKTGWHRGLCALRENGTVFCWQQ